ncbi:phosphomannomutase/phosphoglucomutase [Geovibrio thiophilus]|uniref:Phosphomannomutase/phosphoglucomutase n=1 Tax=Geovibrio thiophilus TaxID=139438 RepID=A0A410K0C4_9BACT|nr:phosphomannomutase/phosphoglucomutase [Geovibrio thiophilus]QAR33728.1 phosphomannomutase/phosphoglucomutase [Geovibrio thiophilus]
MIEASIFRDYDVRGTVPDKLSYEAAALVANAFALKLFKEKGRKCKIAVGRDVRPSSEELFRSTVRGLTDAGADVLDAGVCPSPVLYFTSKTTDADGYVMITGSHNPPEYNGMKFGSDTKVYHSGKIQEIYRSILERGYVQAKEKGTVSSRDMAAEYIKWSIEHFAPLKEKISRLPKKPKVVLDCGNGVASRIAPLLFKNIGVEIVPLFCEEDGTFPNHHPDPTVDKNLRDAIDAVREHGADLAAAYDGDADRIVAVTDSGRIIRGDTLLAVFAEDLCRREQNPVIIGDVKASQALYDILEKCGAKAVMWKAGHSMIKDRMLELNAPLAGETSAHIFFNDRFFGFDDGIYASLRLLEIYIDRRLSGEIENADELVKGFPEYINTPEIRLDFSDAEKFSFVEKVKREFEAMSKTTDLIRDINSIDGVRITFEKGWALLRASNTQPAVVLRFEALDKETMGSYILLLEKITGMKIVLPD